MTTQFINWTYPNTSYLSETPSLCIPWSGIVNAGYIQPGDPSVVKRNGQWTMYFAALKLSNTGVYIFEATLPVGQELGVGGWTINTTPIISPQTSAGAWNRSATETPHYVAGYVSGVYKERIYYAGWNYSNTHPSGLNNYNLSFAEASGSTWVNSNIPMISVEPFEYSSGYGSLIGDPAVVYWQGQWHLYYQATNNAAYTFSVYANSTDGLNWTNKQQVNYAPPSALVNLPNGPYHVGASIINNKLFLTGWLPNSNSSLRGLYAVSSENPLKVKSTDFSEWKPILYESTQGESWIAMADQALWDLHTIGYFGTTIVQDGTNLWNFFGVTTNVSGTRYANIGAARLKVSYNKSRKTVLTGRSLQYSD